MGEKETNRTEQAPASRASTRRTLVLLAVLGVGLAAACGWLMLDVERSRVDAAFQASAAEHAKALERGWAAAFQAVDVLATVFKTSREVTRQEFATATQDILPRHPSVRALEWLPKITHAQRADFVATARQSIPGFELRDLAADGELRPVGRREVYFPIYYVEPLAGNRQVLGYDPSSHRPRNRALHSAIDSGRLTVSTPASIVQNGDAARALLVFVPVYDGDVDLASAAARRRAVSGLVEGVYMLDTLTGDALAGIDSQGLDVTVQVLSDDGRERIAHYPKQSGAASPWYMWGRPAPLVNEWRSGGQAFRAIVTARGGPYAYDIRAPLSVLVLSLLLIAAVLGFAALLLERERRSRALAELRRDQLSHQATHDALTGLLNRGAFELKIGEALESCRAANAFFCLCYLDLDEFKVVNDMYGYRSGDRLLRQVVERLKTHMQASDVLARLGGDEFALLLADTRADQALPAARRLLDAVNNQRFRKGDRKVAVSVTIGITELNRDTRSVGSALGQADAACHIAKEAGRERIHVFGSDDAVSDQYRGQMVWAAELRQALDDNRLVLYGQRIVPCNQTAESREMLEVLVRLTDRNGALISPGQFIPAAERYNLMGDVDRWVVARALSAKAALGDDQVVWCINLSGHSIGERSMFEFIRRALDDHDTAPDTLCFEITETAVVRSLSKAEGFIRALRELGCLVALDDFGSGMSSFVYLKHLPVDFLKIDGSFVRDIMDDRMDRAMVNAIQRIASELHIRTVAEYVENATAGNEVTRLGVDYMQGYHIGHPVPLDRIAQADAQPRSAAR